MDLLGDIDVADDHRFLDNRKAQQVDRMPSCGFNPAIIAFGRGLQTEKTQIFTVEPDLPQSRIAFGQVSFANIRNRHQKLIVCACFKGGDNQIGEHV